MLNNKSNQEAVDIIKSVMTKEEIENMLSYAKEDNVIYTDSYMVENIFCFVMCCVGFLSESKEGGDYWNNLLNERFGILALTPLYLRPDDMSEEVAILNIEKREALRYGYSK